MSHDQLQPTGHPSVREHPEQRRQEETGHEDASDATEVGRPPSKTSDPQNRLEKDKDAA